MTYSDALEWLYSTQLFGIKLGLESPRRLLKEYLAYPPYRTKVIHVAGTNGKGSTCAFIDSISRATGTRTGLFTSPHLVRYGERVRVSGTEIPEDEIANHLTALRELVSGWDPHPTFFELTLALALKHFAERSCELIVLETGMGGRLDATTAVPADVVVLTPIALDHQKWLGESLTEIAEEKAAIICEGKPTFSAPQEPAAHTVIAQTANERRSPLEFVDEPLLGYSLALAGGHQRTNAALAVAALYAAGVSLGYETVKTGLSSVRWPGRFEQLEPAETGRPHDLILDVAHNPSAASALARTWKDTYGDRKATIIFGAVEAKDVAGIFESLLPFAGELRFVPVNSPRAIAPEALGDHLPSEPPPVRTFDSLADALSEPGDGPTLVTGSAFLVGEAKSILEGAPHDTTSQ